ncbi:MAG: winged helix-turn-helix domain-containing protein [Candidatus Euphemobacter frigidus]|nr:winged helix-turn-helix domain-containing protein [Candidatus Euphemobacter frigidus]MDP8276466.1 winged helix-turn-helix domain-containing protein [Candidatus Euphemobacter frigidus]
MNRLAEILSSRVRAEIFRLLFSGTIDELHVREIERRTGFNDKSIREELKKLGLWELVKKRKSSNRLYYRANENHPLYQEIHNLVLKTSGMVEPFREALNG